MLWEAKKHIGATLINTVGAMGWNEQRTKDVADDQTYYAELFGWTFETDITNYTIIKTKAV